MGMIGGKTKNTFTCNHAPNSCLDYHATPANVMKNHTNEFKVKNKEFLKYRASLCHFGLKAAVNIFNLAVNKGLKMFSRKKCCRTSLDWGKKKRDLQWNWNAQQIQEMLYFHILDSASKISCYSGLFTTQKNDNAVLVKGCASASKISVTSPAWQNLGRMTHLALIHSQTLCKSSYRLTHLALIHSQTLRFSSQVFWD